MKPTKPRSYPKSSLRMVGSSFGSNKNGLRSPTKAKYESDKLASGSDDKKRLKKAREVASRKRRQKDQGYKVFGREQALIISFFAVRSFQVIDALIYFVIAHILSGSTCKSCLTCAPV